jgi:GT2 family glycosyltransferase
VPAVTVITPVHNHWHLVPNLLQCLAAQTLPQSEFEIVLVENRSDNYQPPDQLPPNARIEHCTTPGSYAARNHAIERATGNWLVFTDADCLPRPDWLEKLMNRAGQADDNTILAGAIEMVPQNDPPNRWEIYDLVRGIPQAWYVKRGYAATANLVVSAALTRKLEGFDGNRQSGGDAEFCRRAIRQNAQLKYVPEAIVAHPARTSRAELVEKTRRIKAAQVQSGDWRRLRALAPPLIEFWKYLGASQWPLSYRLTAIAVQLTLWPTELNQALKGAPTQE